MTGPQGFTPVDGGWGRAWPGAWQRPGAPGVWQHLREDPTDGGWAAAVHLDARWTVFGQPVADWQRRQPEWWAPTTFAGVDAARAFLDAHTTPAQVVDALLTQRLVPPPRVSGVDPLQALLDAVAVLVVERRTADAGRLVAGVRGATPEAADRLARLAGRAGLPRPRAGVVGTAGTAEVVALLTRVISADLGLARARRWAKRWLAADCDPRLQPALAAVVRLASPPDDAAAVAAWQAGLERVRSEVVGARGRGWPARLPGVGRELLPPRPPLPAPEPVPVRPLVDRAFERHAGFCGHGRPPDGRRRVDLFFDYSAFPVWWNGGGGMASPGNLAMPLDLAADLWSWSDSHNRRAVPGGPGRAADAVVRHETPRLRLLGARLERSAGVVAVVQQHRGRGDGSCPTERCLGPAPC